MLKALSGTMVTGETMPIPDGFTEEQCSFIHSICQSRASNSYSRSYFHIGQERVGRTVNNIFIWENTSVTINDGTVNYVVFAKTSDEMAGLLTGTVVNGESIPAPAGTFVTKHSFVSVASIESSWNQLGLKYFKCTISATNTAEVFGVREDVVTALPGTAHFITIGVP